jgi:hypothetical protein
MEEQGSLDLPGAGWPAWRWLVLLLVLVAGMRAWQVCHTEVASRDSIAYIRYAWRLEHEPWLEEVIPHGEHHPGYPLAVYLASKLVRHFLPDDRPRAMQLAAQLVSCLASLLLVFPMFFIGRELFDARVGFWGALLFQCLPGPGRVLADGLSDPLFLLFAATSVWMAMIALRTGKARWFVLVGFTGALAYLTRTEGLLIVVVTALVILGLQRSQRWRRPWPRVWGNEAGLLAGALPVVPFMLLIGGLTLKPSGIIMLHSSALSPEAAHEPQQAALVSFPVPLAKWMFYEGIGPKDRWGWSAKALVVELDKGFFHLLGVPALLGMILFRRRFAEVPGAWVMLGCGTVLSLLLYRLGQSNGYLGERHVLLLVMGGIYFAVAFLAVLGGWLARILSHWRSGLTARTVSLVLLVMMAVAPLSRTLARLHAERAGFKQAGLWLAENARPGDWIIDPFAWAQYYAGCEFLPPPLPHPPVWYIVLEESTNPHLHLDHKLRAARVIVERHHAEPIKRFPLHGKHTGEVVVYRVRVRG